MTGKGERLAVAAMATGSRMRRGLRTYRFPLVAVITWRVAHLLALAAFGGLSGAHTPDRPDYFVWDGGWYRELLRHGYEPMAGREQPTAFFPLLPWITWVVRTLVGSELLAAVLMTTVASGCAVLVVYACASRWAGEKAARWTVVLLLAFPSSVFLWLFYTEALYIAVTGGAVLAHAHRRPLLATLLLGAAAMTRPLGIMVAGVLAIDAWRRERSLATARWYAFASVGVVIVSAVQHVQAGDAFAWMRSAEDWGRSLGLPGEALGAAARRYLESPAKYADGWGASAPYGAGSPVDVAGCLLFVSLAVAAVRHKWPLVVVGLIVTHTAIPLLFDLLSSASRYLLAAWPAFAVLARQTVRVRVAAAALFAAVNVATLHDLAHGYFIG